MHDDAPSNTLGLTEGSMRGAKKTTSTLIPKDAPPAPKKRVTKKKAPTVTSGRLGVYKLYTDSPDIKYGTLGSACFDIEAYLPSNEKVFVYTHSNDKIVMSVRNVPSQKNNVILLSPGDRALIPTGLIFDIQDGYHVKVHPRSGTSWKLGLGLTNSTGIIDSDYVDQLYISIINNSGARVFVGNGERIAQCEIVKNQPVEVYETTQLPKRTTRTGGFGSTGK